MKKIRIIQFIELILLIGVLVILVTVLTLVGKNSTQGDKGYQLEWSINGLDGSFWGEGSWIESKRQQVALEEIQTIELDFSQADLIFSTSDNTSLEIVQRNNKEVNSQRLFEVKEAEKRVVIQGNDRGDDFGIFNFPNLRYRIEVSLPKSYTGELVIRTASGDISLRGLEALEKLVGSTSSGDIEIDQIQTKVYSLEATSGDIEAGQLTGEGTLEASSGDIEIGKIVGAKHKIKTSSGEIEVDSIEGDIRINTTSGDIAINQLVSANYSLTSSSGEIEVKNLSGTSEGEVETTSGNIEVTYKQLTGKVGINASSGNVQVDLSKDFEGEIEASVSSGDIKGNVDFNYKAEDKKQAEVIMGDATKAKLSIETTSGNIDVYQR